MYDCIQYESISLSVSYLRLLLLLQLLLLVVALVRRDHTAQTRVEVLHRGPGAGTGDSTGTDLTAAGAVQAAAAGVDVVHRFDIVVQTYTNKPRTNNAIS